MLSKHREMCLPTQKFESKKPVAKINSALHKDDTFSGGDIFFKLIIDYKKKFKVKTRTKQFRIRIIRVFN